jgi:hypothetical protein
MTRFFRIVCILTLILSSTLLSSLPQEGTELADNGSAKKDQEIPKSEIARRQALDDINDQINKANASANTWTTISAYWKQSNDAIASAETPDFDGLLKQVEENSKAGKKVEAYTAVSELISGFNVLFRSASGAITQTSRASAERDVTSFVDRCRTDLSPIEKQFYPLALKRFKILGIDPDFLDIDSLKKLPSLTADDLKLLQSTYSKAQYEDFKSKIGALVTTSLAQATNNAKQKQDEVPRLRARKAAILAELDKPNTEINDLAIRLGLPLFCVTVVVLICFPIFLQTRSTGDGLAAQIKAIFGSGILVEINTVLLLTMTILILGLAGKLQGEVLGTLIGGISGYVLNRFRDKAPARDSTPDNEESVKHQ